MEYFMVATIAICAWEAGKQIAGFIKRWWDGLGRGIGA